MKNWLRDALRRLLGPRRGVVICGAYGMDNAGDDAVLSAIVASLRRLDRDMPITVLARRGKRTGRRAGVGGVSRWNIPGWLTALGRAKLFILGGGSLLQTATSRRSLFYYLAVLRAARTAGCRTMLYAVGAGPIRRDKDRTLAAEYLNKYAQVITVRDEASRRTLADWRVTAPRVLLSADPTLCLETHATERERKAGIALRPWPGFWTHVPDFAQAARYIWEQYRLAPVFLCLAPEDRQAAKSVCAELDGVPWSLSADPRRVGRMSLVLGMRLHALIFALRDGVPAGGVSYDGKIDAFCAEAGLPMAALEDVTGEALCELADWVMHMDGEHLSAAQRTLRTREKTNLSAAAELLAAE